MSKSGPPARGTILYRCEGEADEIFTYVFLEESVVEGAILPTWLIRDKSFNRIRISKGNSYRLTRKEALRDALDASRDGLRNNLDHVKEVQAHIKADRARIANLKKRIEQAD